MNDSLSLDRTQDQTQTELEKKRAVLERWLADRMPAVRDISVTRIVSTGGLSHEILNLDISWRVGDTNRDAGFMVRFDPVHYRKRQQSNLRREFDVLSVLCQRGDVPVPLPYWYEEDDTLLGSAFYAMERVAGRTAVDQPPYQLEGWIYDLAPVDRAQFWRSAVTTMARIHAAPAEAFTILRRNQSKSDDFDQHLASWYEHYLWALGQGTNSITDRAWDWLLANIPANRPAGLAWGDARYVNFMFKGLSCNAVLDWEDVSLSSPLFDLGRWFLTQRLHDAWELPRLEGLGNREQTLALWELCSGLSAADLRWYELFAAATATALAKRTADLKASAPGGRSSPPKFTTAVLDAIVLELLDE